MQERARRERCRSSALVITLACLTIVTIMLIAYISVVSRDRDASANYAQALRAEQIGLGGLDQVIAQLQAEIIDPYLSTPNGSSPNIIYIPTANTNAVTQRIVPFSDNYATLLKISTNSAPFFISKDGIGASSLASPSISTNISLNGRSVSIAGWNAPMMATSTNGFPAPDWIIVTRKGPQAFSAYTSLLANAALTNSTYAVGRYAYAVYDTSGLIDINVAGNPSTSTTTNSGVLPFSDLTQLTNAVTQTDVDNLVRWRNASSYSSYLSYITNWASNGFMQVAPGDTAFLSRQDLIKYAQAQNTDLTNALPFLTTFTRELNGPSWGLTTNAPGGAPYNYQNQQYTSGGTNVFIMNPRVQAGGWTRANGTLAVAGEPLVKYRFPLGKLALLGKMQGTGTLSSSEIAQVQQYFGLDIASDVTSGSGYYRHWTYPTTNPAYPHTAGVILTLDQVAALNREPDFFELLQAGILAGSLGACGRGDWPPYYTAAIKTVAAQNDPDKNVAYQIIQIGANIIDQTHADAYPTTITFGSADFYGIEDLPYLNKLLLRVYAANPKTPPIYPYLFYELWNPHQYSASSAASVYPTSFEISPLPATNINADGYEASLLTAHGYWNWQTNNTYDDLQMAYFANQGAGGNVTFTASPTAYREPSLITNGAPLLPAAENNPAVAGVSLQPITAYPTNNAPPNYVPTGVTGYNFTNTVTNPTALRIFLNTTLRLQFQDQAGNYHTYGTFVGLDTGNSYSAISTHTSGFAGYCTLPLSSSTSTANGVIPVVKSDPRTWRFGAGVSYDSNFAVANDSLNPSSSQHLNRLVAADAYGPQGNNGSTANPYLLDRLAVNDPNVLASGNSTNSYLDPDGSQRYGDAHDSPTVDSPFYTGDSRRRPVILHRPFQSVGELGYSFRGEPWKTLDFSSSSSPDAALLDLFTVENGPIISGRVNPNTPYPPVINALLAGASTTYASSGTLPGSASSQIADAVVETTSSTPFTTRADLVDQLMTNSAITNFSPVKTEREVVVRALAESANTRTWNFLIDLIAQSGRYPATGASTLDNFIVEGQRRYWLHVAIDRYTSQIVDEQLEMVNQ